ncbi:hypothetical protein QJS66_15780 [Kocuria rhizophila]|nr:hypothetical protein QJS66_15780 [Kocuria rhizophila]
MPIGHRQGRHAARRTTRGHRAVGVDRGRGHHRRLLRPWRGARRPRTRRWTPPAAPWTPSSPARA